MNIMKKLTVLLITVILILSSAITPYAGAWDSGPGTVKWEQQPDGRWKCRCGQDYNRNKVVSSKGHRYYLDHQGYLGTGWQYCDGRICYFAETESEGRPLGSMYVNEATPDGHQVDADGVLIGELGCRPNPYQRTCIEVSIPEQQVYVYNGASLILQTPCVTGKVSAGTVTPAGNYAIQAKVRDKTLKGKNVDGSDYSSFVHYWMPFYNWSYGLHDASWRGRFGGEIYKTGGSHGCVNLPSDAAAAIFNFTYVGMPVFVHE